MSASKPGPLGSSTLAADISSKQATYLPPSELAVKYAKGIHNHTPATPHASLTATGSNPHLIKKIENFYVRPRWLFVRVRPDEALSGEFRLTMTARLRLKAELSDGVRALSKDIQNPCKAAWMTWQGGMSLESTSCDPDRSLNRLRLVGWDAMNIEDVSLETKDIG